MVNVTISDGEYFSEEDYDKIKNLYINTDTPVETIKKDYGIPANQWKNIRKRIVKETGFIRRIKTGKYYTKTKSGKYQVLKSTNRITSSYGTYDTREQAEKVVAFLKEHNWDKEMLEAMKRGCFYNGFRCFL